MTQQTIRKPWAVIWYINGNACSLVFTRESYARKFRATLYADPQNADISGINLITREPF